MNKQVDENVVIPFSKIRYILCVPWKNAKSCNKSKWNENQEEPLCLSKVISMDLKSFPLFITFRFWWRVCSKLVLSVTLSARVMEASRREYSWHQSREGKMFLDFLCFPWRRNVKDISVFKGQTDIFGHLHRSRCLHSTEILWYSPKRNV